MVKEAEKVSQQLGLEILTDENSLEKAFKFLEKIGVKTKETSEAINEATKGAGDFGNALNKDVGSVLEKLTGSLGAFASVLKAAGPIAAITEVALILQGAMAELSKEMIEVNRQSAGFSENMQSVERTTRQLMSMGFKSDEADAVMKMAAKSGAFQNSDQLESGTRAIGAISKSTGIDVGEITNVVSQLTKSGAVDASNIEKSLFSSGIFQGLIKGSAEASTSISQYTKEFNELYMTTRNFNSDWKVSNEFLRQFSEELHTGTMSVSQVGAIATGSGTSQSAELLLAERMGIKGSPLEMITKFEDMRASGNEKFMTNLGKQIFDIAHQYARSPQELVQMVRKVDEMFGTGLVGEGRRGEAQFAAKYGGEDTARQMRDAFPQFSDKLAESEIKKDILHAENVKQAKMRADAIGDASKLYNQLEMEAMSARGLMDSLKLGVDEFRRHMGSSAAETMMRSQREALGLEPHEKLDQPLLPGQKSKEQNDLLTKALNMTPEQQNKLVEKYQKPTTIDFKHESTIVVKQTGKPNQTSKKAGAQKIDIPASNDLGLEMQ